MAKINPYLHFLGNSEEVFSFYQSVFGGEFAMLQRFGEMPGCEEMKLSDEDKQKIMHIALPISDGHVLMATDAVGEHAKDAVIGNNISLSVAADSKEEADKIFNGLSNGGTVTMPLADTFWGAYFGMCKDKFGIQWMINYDYPQNQEGK
jgi:PhnB protein